MKRPSMRLGLRLRSPVSLSGVSLSCSSFDPEIPSNMELYLRSSRKLDQVDEEVDSQDHDATGVGTTGVDAVEGEFTARPSGTIVLTEEPYYQSK